MFRAGRSLFVSIILWGLCVCVCVSQGGGGGESVVSELQCLKTFDRDSKLRGESTCG